MRLRRPDPDGSPARVGREEAGEAGATSATEPMEPAAAGRQLDRPVWPVATVCLALLLALVQIADLGSPWRPMVALVFLTVVPGASLVPLLGIEDFSVQATLVVPLSFAVVALTAAVLFYPSLWSPARELELVTSLSLVGFALQRFELRRRAIAAGATVPGNAADGRFGRPDAVPEQAW
jgi:uncharacterized membrane protein